MSFPRRRLLGQTQLSVSPLGIGSSYGVGAKAIEAAYHEQGVNLLYWGSVRRPGMKRAIRNLKAHREDLVVVLQSYDRSGVMMPLFHKKGLRDLQVEYADLLLLGWYNSDPPKRIVDQALALKEAGLVRYIAISGHHRPYQGELMAREHSPFDVVMTRYNAAHPGASRTSFPTFRKSHEGSWPTRQPAGGGFSILKECRKESSR